MRTRLSRRAWLQKASRLGGGLACGISPLARAVQADWLTPDAADAPYASGVHTEWLQGAGAPQKAAAAQAKTKEAVSPASSAASLFNGDPTKYRFTPGEEQFLEDLERACFRFFWEEVNPFTGLVKDRSQASGPDARNVASMAATGFGLTGLCIGDQRGWEDKNKIRERVRNTLRFVATRLPQAHGFFCHFVNMQNGDRVFNSEVSSIDTAIFICGVLTCRGYFDDAEIHDLATTIFGRVDWKWLMRGHDVVSMAWTPERGFTRSRWDTYSELMMIYLLGMGANGLPKASWDAWSRPAFEFNGIKYIGAYAPLFAHQYSHAWFDFRGKRDRFADYFTNSMVATKVHKIWCTELSQQFPDYSDDLWGITASDSSHGYAVWGGPPVMGRIDGTVVPCAAGGSLAFLPEETLQVLQNIQEKYEKRAWRRYGFVDAFNPLTNWYSPDVIGIDVGVTMLMAENARTGFVWQHFMKNDVVVNGMARAGFHPIPRSEMFAPPHLPSGLPMWTNS